MKITAILISVDANKQSSYFRNCQKMKISLKQLFFAIALRVSSSWSSYTVKSLFTIMVIYKSIDFLIN